MEEERFWLMIAASLQASDYSKKLSLNILKHYIQHISKSGDFTKQLNIIKGSTKSEKEFSKCWSYYFVLIEISDEKQLHLVTPALALLNKINSLHSLWIIRLYKIFISHTQGGITFFVANMILKSNLVDQIELFKNVIYCLLPALNRYEYSDNFLTVFQNLNKISKTFRDEHFYILLKESLNVNWSPVPAWYFYSNILLNIAEHNVDINLIISNINHIKSLPNVFIRESCYLVLVNFLIRNHNFSDLNLSEFVNLAYELKKCDIKLLPVFFQFADRNLLMYNTNNSLKLEILLGIFKNKIDITIIINNLFKSVNICDEDEEYLALYLSKHNFKDFNTVGYLQQKLEILDTHNNIKNINILCEIASYIKINDTSGSSLLNKCKIILLNAEKYDINCIALAFKIYNGNADADVGNILAVWHSKLMKGEKIESMICKSYLHIYFKHMRVFNQSLSTSDEIHQIFSLIFDTQPEDIWLDIYENFDLILINLQNEKILAVTFERIFKEFTRFKYTENLLKAWSSFVKIILHNQDIFKIENIKSQLVQNISELTLSSHLTVYIFIRELLNINNNNIILPFLNLSVDLLLYGGVYKKDKRCEYFACREIDNMYKVKDNPIYLPSNIRCTALNIVLCILNSNEENVANSITKLLLGKYSQHYKKRYFPESQIHLSKLRIIQALLIVTPYSSDDNKRSITEFIIDSFCEESHQPCVKQLMQLLLITILRENRQYMDAIFEKMDTVNRTHASTIVAFVPVLCHVGYRENADFIEKLMRTILKWTMGAHFKLRVYSQIAIVKLMDISAKRNYTKILYKYEYLYKSVKTVLEMAGANVNNILQTDKFFFDEFDMENYYNLETVYINVPRLNDVTETEWELIDLQIISNCKRMPLTGSKINSDDIIKKKINNSNDIEVYESIKHLQKKILPWKDFADVENEERPNLTELIVVASLVENSANLGGLARTSEVYGVKQLMISDRKIAEDKEFKSLSMSSEYWVDISEVKVDGLEEYLERVKEIGYLVIGAEQTPESVKLHNYKFPRKCVLVLGNEREGIPSSILPYLDVCIEIPQFGVVRSLNVHVAGATTIWEYVKQNVLQ